METPIAEKKMTLATLKSFIAKNAGKLWIKNTSNFDGQVDGIILDRNAEFVPTAETIMTIANTLRIQGAWLVLGGRDHFSKFETDEFIGIEVSNCCGNFAIAIKKNKK